MSAHCLCTSYRIFPTAFFFSKLIFSHIEFSTFAIFDWLSISWFLNLLSKAVPNTENLSAVFSEIEVLCCIGVVYPEEKMVFLSLFYQNPHDAIVRCRGLQYWMITGVFGQFYFPHGLRNWEWYVEDCVCVYIYEYIHIYLKKNICLSKYFIYFMQLFFPVLICQ